MSSHPNRVLQVMWRALLLVMFQTLFAQPGLAAKTLEQVTSNVVPNGVYECTRTLVIPRQRAGILAPPPYLGDQPSSPGGVLRGQDQFGTVLRFGPGVTGQLIKTELYGEQKVGNGATSKPSGSGKIQSNLSSSASDLTIDGGAEIRAYPWGYPTW